MTNTDPNNDELDPLITSGLKTNKLTYQSSNKIKTTGSSVDVDADSNANVGFFAVFRESMLLFWQNNQITKETTQDVVHLNQRQLLQQRLNQHLCQQ